MTTLLILLTYLTLTNLTFGQSTKNSIIQGKIFILFGMKKTKYYDSYVSIKGTNNKVIIDSTGHFQLKDVHVGETTIRIELWDGTFIKDTIIKVQSDIQSFKYFQFFNCDENKYTAIYDIRYEKPKLLISGGNSPIVYTGQEKFEEKFGIQYHDYGCLPLVDTCMLEYNNIIFDYLDQTHGKKWRKEVRKDVVGVKKK